MGFGSAPFGTTPFGLDAQVISVRRQRKPPAALAFNGLTKDYELDADGQYKGVHPVDAKVFLILRTAVGSLRSAPDIGQGVSNLRYIERDRIRAYAQDQVRRALAAVVAAKEIRIESITVDSAARGRVVLVVTYVNLITLRRQVTPPIPLAA